MRFSLDLLTGYRVRKTLTRECALHANTLIFASAFDLWLLSWTQTRPLIWLLTYDPDLETWPAILICNPDLQPWPATLNLPLAWLSTSDRRLLTCDPDLTSDLTCYHWPTAADLRLPDLWLDFWPDIWPNLWSDLWPATLTCNPDLRPWLAILSCGHELWLRAATLSCNPNLRAGPANLTCPISVMSETGNGSKDEYTFKKLQGSHNYKQWKRDMRFALE